LESSLKGWALEPNQGWEVLGGTVNGTWRVAPWGEYLGKGSQEGQGPFGKRGLYSDSKPESP